MFQVFLFLWLVSLARPKNIPSKDETPVAYSSTYISFGSNTNSKEVTLPENLAIDVPPSKITPQYELYVDGMTTPINDDKIIKLPPLPTPPNEPAPIYEVNDENNSNFYFQVQQEYEMPVTTNDIFSKAKLSSSLPLKTPIRGKDRFITPGLSSYASSGEEIETERAQITEVIFGNMDESKKYTETLEELKVQDSYAQI